MKKIYFYAFDRKRPSLPDGRPNHGLRRFLIAKWSGWMIFFLLFYTISAFVGSLKMHDLYDPIEWLRRGAISVFLAAISAAINALWMEYRFRSTTK